MKKGLWNVKFLQAGSRLRKLFNFKNGQLFNFKNGQISMTWEEVTIWRAEAKKRINSRPLILIKELPTVSYYGPMNVYVGGLGGGSHKFSL